MKVSLWYSGNAFGTRGWSGPVCVCVCVCVCVLVHVKLKCINNPYRFSTALLNETTLNSN